MINTSHRPIMQNLITSLALLSFLVFSCSSTLTITNPPNLQLQFSLRYPLSNSIPYNIANYGRIPYGKSIHGQIGIPHVLSDCLPQDQSVSHLTGKIVLLERGDCTFTQKSLNVQVQGGKLALIMDNVENEQPSSFIAVDDGRGSMVKIPTIIISRADGQIILNATKSQNVTIAMTITFPTNKADKVNLTLLLESDNRHSYMLIRRFKPYFTQIQNYINFTPIYTTKKCSLCSPQNCYAAPLYCKSTPPSAWDLSNPGQIVIQQQLREQFVFQHYGSQWWQFVLNVDDKCGVWSSMGQCSGQIMRSMGMAAEMIDKLVTNATISADKNNTSTNILLSNQMIRSKSGIVISPAAVVNAMPERGNLQAYELFELICASLQSPPSQCNEALGKQSAQTHHSTPIWAWFLLALCGFVIFGVSVVCCWRRVIRRQTSRSLNVRVSELVNEYITMHEAERMGV